MNNKVKLSVVACAVSSALFFSNVALADDGFVLGKTVSQSGQILADVTVTLTNKDTGLTRTVTSDANGNFKFPLLPPGIYKMEAKKNGFLLVQNDNLIVSGSGKTSVNVTLEQGDIERISVTGSRVAAIDVTSSESQLVVDMDFLDKVPVSRDVTSVALLAPGTIEGDSDFGNLASFGGSSVGENVFYVNGINVTNFRNGLGGSELPFEMYETFEVKTGGYSAEFGRSTGGVVNARTKSGTNEFKWGASAYFEPNSLRAKQPDVLRTDPANIEEAGTKYYLVNNKDVNSETNINLWASGALIEDKLFFFGLVNQKIRESDYASTTNFYDREGNDTLYALKLDWYITENHILEFTGWDNSSDLDTSKYSYNPDEDETSDFLGDYTLERGGKTWGLKYTGILSDELTLSAQYAVNKASYSNLNSGSNPLGDKPAIYERYSGKEFGGFGLFTPSIQHDKRTSYRLDVDWYVHDDHTLRFGIDYEDLKATENTQRAGGVAYRYQGCDTDLLAAGQLDCSIVRQEFYINSGDFKTKSYAYYIEDTWQVTDNIVARIGLRNETFENYNKAGDKFVDVSNQWAPRVGVSWDINGEGETKVFANYGKYYLPVATNTNIRLAGDELYTRQFFEVLSIGDDFVPVLGDALTSKQIFGDGKLKSTLETVNADLKPMYQSEYILGFEHVINESWNMGVKATYRSLDSSLEDIAIDKGFNDFIEANFPGETCTNCSGFHYYVLTNPGEDVTITTDPDGEDGALPLQAYTIPADVLGYPKAERQYAAVDFVLNRVWDDQWQMNFTYTWAHSWGNNEGFVRSDNDQDDAGLTTNFDQPGLVDGASGNLPNDRRHVFKINGAYALTDNLILGANFRWAQGRPRSSFGYHPTDVFASWYGAESFVKDGQLTPRGSLGRTPSTWNLDLSAKYTMELSGTPVTLRADVFNVFNNNKATQLNEINERYSYSDDVTGRDVGEPNPTYGLPTSFQTPRYVRFSVNVEF